MAIFLLVVASLCFATGGLFMKYSDGFRHLGPSALVFVFFCAGAACQTLAMKRTDMAVAYVFVLGLEAVVALGLSLFVLGERLTPGRLAAVALIIAGIIALERT
jgi:multidrug transporter EmrE-like cation transporter